MTKSRTVKIALCGMFAATTAVMAQIAIPLGPVFINFAHISVFLSAGILGAKYGAVSQLVYIVLGIMGLPVFSGFSGGVHRLMGPTGGYIVAYVLAAYIVGLVIKHFGRKSSKVLIVAMILGWLVTYTLGTLWYCYVTDTSIVAALSICVFPFIIGDIVKTLLSVVMIKRLWHYIKNIL